MLFHQLDQRMKRFLRAAELSLQIEHPLLDVIRLVLLCADLALLNEIPKETHLESSFRP